MGDARELWRDVSGIGPFFAVSANPAECVDDSWRPLRELFTDPGPLAERTARVADALGGAPARVAASITHQGLAARLVSAPLALAAVHGVSAPWTADVVHWRPAVTGPWPLWVSDSRLPGPPGRARTAAGPARDAGVLSRDTGDLAREVAGEVLVPLLEALAAAVRRQWSVSTRTLSGNAASSVVAAGRMVARARPPAAARAHALVAAVLERGPLVGSGDLGPGWAFRRRSCCLYHRAPGGGLCGDCVLTGRRPGQR